MNRPKTWRFISLGLLLACVLLVVWVLVTYVSSSPLIEEEVTDLSVIQQKQLEMYVEMIKLLITLCTFLLGLIGAMFTHFYEKKPTPPWQARWALIAAGLSGFSIICGYLSYQQVISMLRLNFFNLSQPHIAWPSWLQFGLFLASVAIAALFGYRATEEHRG